MGRTSKPAPGSRCPPTFASSPLASSARSDSRSSTVLYCLWVAGSFASRKALQTFPATRAIADSLGILRYAQLTGYLLSTVPAATEPGARPLAGSEGPPSGSAGEHARRRRGGPHAGTARRHTPLQPNPDRNRPLRSRCPAGQPHCSPAGTRSTSSERCV